MVIEWSVVVNYDNPASPATFQAILEHNTGSRAWTITFNYFDLIVGAPAGDGGASAAVGIKAAGTSGGNRVLASLDRPGNPWLGSGRAMRFGLDEVPSQIPSATAPAKRLARVKLQMSEVSGLPAPADFSVINRASGASVSLATASVSVDAVSGEITLAMGKKLPDGEYQISVAAGKLVDASGNHNFVALAANFSVGTGVNGQRPATRALRAPAKTGAPFMDLSRRYAGFFARELVGPKLFAD